jgi:transcriptional repressor NrdR
LAILGTLRDLDEVAYLRFASVYRSFESLEDFEREISTLRQAGGAAQQPATTAAANGATNGANGSVVSATGYPATG